MTRKSKKEQAKEELAERLGLAPTDILARAEVALLMDPPTSKSALAKNLDAFPPFITKGERYAALYPRPWVEEHLSKGKVMRGGIRLIGAQSWPAPPPPPPPVDPAKRDNALGLLDTLGVEVRPGISSVDAREIEEYRKIVSGDS